MSVVGPLFVLLVVHTSGGWLACGADSQVPSVLQYGVQPPWRRCTECLIVRIRGMVLYVGGPLVVLLVLLSICVNKYYCLWNILLTPVNEVNLCCPNSYLRVILY